MFHLKLDLWELCDVSNGESGSSSIYRSFVISVFLLLCLPFICLGHSFLSLVAFVILSFVSLSPTLGVVGCLITQTLVCGFC